MWIHCKIGTYGAYSVLPVPSCSYFPKLKARPITIRPYVVLSPTKPKVLQLAPKRPKQSTTFAPKYLI